MAEIESAKVDASMKDLHSWCFVPQSFRLIINDLHLLGYTSLKEAAFYNTEGCEFCVVLSRSGNGNGSRLSRLELLKQLDSEIKFDAGATANCSEVKKCRLRDFLGRVLRKLSSRC